MAGQGLSQRGWAAGEAGPKPCWPRADATRKLESAPRALDRRRARARVASGCVVAWGAVGRPLPTPFPIHTGHPATQPAAAQPQPAAASRPPAHHPEPASPPGRHGATGARPAASRSPAASPPRSATAPYPARARAIRPDAPSLEVLPLGWPRSSKMSGFEAPFFLHEVLLRATPVRS